MVGKPICNTSQAALDGGTVTTISSNDTLGGVLGDALSEELGE